MNHFLTSLTRISDLNRSTWSVQPLPRGAWSRGDYVAGEVVGLHGLRQIELINGRMMELAQGDVLVGAFGDRYATLEATGSWRDIRDDGEFHCLTSAGLLGRARSRSDFVPQMMRLKYRGHVIRHGTRVRMEDFVQQVPVIPYRKATVLVMGTSMSAGKTTASRIVIRQLRAVGLRVVGAKLTGAGRFRDILSMSDAGADVVYDFTDVGLPSTVLGDEEFKPYLDQLLTRIESTDTDVAVVEIGASPLEPYGGMAAVERIRDSVRCTILAASDPYGVVGVTVAFGRGADLVTGIAANTEAGIRLVEKLTGRPAINLRDKNSLPRLRGILFPRLGIETVGD
ncbi:MAG: hypothetical protein HKN17_05925 [Rhodothermales bacterium]|nr:hypothetical protein [Rhodothermales bacterium]